MLSTSQLVSVVSDTTSILSILITSLNLNRASCRALSQTPTRGRQLAADPDLVLSQKKKKKEREKDVRLAMATTATTHKQAQLVVVGLLQLQVQLQPTLISSTTVDQRSFTLVFSSQSLPDRAASFLITPAASRILLY